MGFVQRWFCKQLYALVIDQFYSKFVTQSSIFKILELKNVNIYIYIIYVGIYIYMFYRTYRETIVVSI